MHHMLSPPFRGGVVQSPLGKIEDSQDALKFGIESLRANAWLSPHYLVEKLSVAVRFSSQRGEDSNSRTERYTTSQARIAVQATNLLQSICRLQYPPKDLARLRLDLFSICRLRSSSASAMERVTHRCLLEGPLQ